MARIPSRGSDQFVVRFPDGMRDRIKVEASRNGRSMNAEVMVRLEASFGTTSALAPEIAALIERHVEQQVQERLRRIASKISGGE